MRCLGKPVERPIVLEVILRNFFHIVGSAFPKAFVFSVSLLLSACSTWRVVPSRAVHKKTVRSPSSAVVAREPQALKGEPLAYELEQARFSWPVAQSAVSSLYGPRWGRVHEGIDIAAPTGTPVRAARAGKVLYAQNGIRGYGKLVILRHSPNFATVYAHLSRIGVRAGDFVERGKVIGKVGMTGRATSPHLHFEIRHRRASVDPLIYLPGRMAFSRIKR